MKQEIAVDVTELAGFYLNKVKGFVLDNFSLYKEYPSKAFEIAQVVDALYVRDPVKINYMMENLYPKETFLLSIDMSLDKDVDVKIMDGENEICVYEYKWR